MTAIPWKEILTTTPFVVDSARRLYDFTRKRTESRVETDPAPDQLVELKAKIIELEAINTRQAELLTQLAAQVEGLTEVTQALAGRVAFLTAVSIVAVLVALTATVLAMVR